MCFIARPFTFYLLTDVMATAIIMVYVLFLAAPVKMAFMATVVTNITVQTLFVMLTSTQSRSNIVLTVAKMVSVIIKTNQVGVNASTFMVFRLGITEKIVVWLAVLTTVATFQDKNP
jgi:hypothetical protein